MKLAKLPVIRSTHHAALVACNRCYLQLFSVHQGTVPVSLKKNRESNSFSSHLSLIFAIKYQAAIWRLRKLSEISDYVKPEPPSGNHYQLHCIRWTKTTSKYIVETKTWTIQYKIQWHNVLFQRSSFTMTMTTSARGLKQSQCDRSFSKTKIYAMIDHEVIERRMQWHSKKVLLNDLEQVVPVTWFDLIFFQKWWIWRLDDGVYNTK